LTLVLLCILNSRIRS